jgi:hypothetical protein
MRFPFRLAALPAALAAILMLAGSASAEPTREPKQKKQTNVSAPAQKPARAASVYRGTDKFRAGPLFNGPDYLGDDPDPFIRSQIQRDLSARYGGDD